MPPSDPILGPPIKVTHFGLSNPSAAAHPAGSDFDTAPDRRHGCHRPNRDIVAAPHFAGQAALAERTYLRAAAGGAAGGPAPAAVAGSVAAAAAGAAGGALAGGETGAAVAADSLAVAPARTMLAAEGKAAAAAAAGGAEAQGPHPPAEAGAAPAAAPEAAAAFDSITAGGDAPGDAVAGATASATDAAAGGEGGGALAFFAGDIREDDKSYSGGIRQVGATQPARRRGWLQAVRADRAGDNLDQSFSCDCSPAPFGRIFMFETDRRAARTQRPLHNARCTTPAAGAVPPVPLPPWRAPRHRRHGLGTVRGGNAGGAVLPRAVRPRVGHAAQRGGGHGLRPRHHPGAACGLTTLEVVCLKTLAFEQARRHPAAVRLLLRECCDRPTVAPIPCNVAYAVAA